MLKITIHTITVFLITLSSINLSISSMSASPGRPTSTQQQGHSPKLSGPVRKPAPRPPSTKLSRPGDVVKSRRPPSSVLSRPGDIAKSRRPPSSVLSRPGDVARKSTGSSHVGKVKPRPVEVRSAHKRKSASPSVPAFGSSSEGESDSEVEGPPVVKKSKNVSETQPGGPKRMIRDAAQWINGNGSIQVIHGADLTSGDHEKDFIQWFDADNPESDEILLQYPNAQQQERFRLLAPRKDDGYRPHEDVCETIRHTLNNYFPEETSRKYLDDASGLPFRLIRALNRRNIVDYKTVIDEYNVVVTQAREDATMQSTLDEMHALSLPLVQRILDQVTARTVSPKTDLLLQYQSFSSNTYGELLAPFNSQIFLDTEMHASSVFLDLGSGVGNVVLQAALEVGCESHGIEIMPNPCELGRAQAAEFPGRCRMWGLSHGPINLLEGDFLEDARLPAILQRVDVVLVNNVLFDSTLNENLTRLFLDLKDGARIVSLKSFVPEGWRLDERKRESILGMLEVEKKSFWSGCVSWTGSGGDYFVATKDTKRIERVLGKSSTANGTNGRNR